MNTDERGYFDVLTERVIDDELRPLEEAAQAMSYIGLDVGKKHDPTAIAVVERVERARPFQPAVFDRLAVRHVERPALGTPYPLAVDAMGSGDDHGRGARAL